MSSLSIKIDFLPNFKKVDVFFLSLYVQPDGSSSRSRLCSAATLMGLCFYNWQVGIIVSVF